MSKDDFRLPLVDEATEPIEVVEALCKCVAAVHQAAVADGVMAGRGGIENLGMVSAGVGYLCRLFAEAPQDQVDHILKVLKAGEKTQQEQGLKDPGGLHS